MVSSETNTEAQKINKGYKIIDAHTHNYPEAVAEKACANLGKFYNFTVECCGTHEDIEKQATECGVCGFVLLSVATNAHQVEKVNDTVAALVNESKSRGFEAAAFAAMHQDYPDFRSEVERIRRLGLVGVKLHPDIQGVAINSEKLLPLYEILEKEGLPLFLHMGDERAEYRFSEPKKLAEILKKFPELKVIAAHYGGYKSWNAAREYLFGNKNVWYDCSSALWAMTPEEAETLTHECGACRVMFGTDYPVMPIKEYLELFFKLNLTDSERRDILYNNVKKLLF